MILTYASSTLKATVPEAMRTYILKKRNDVVVFIRNIMDNVNYQDAYDKLVERIDKSLRFVTRIQDGLKKDVEKKKDSSLQLADVFACDAFSGLDDIIIDWALEQLNDEILDAQIDGLNIAQVADQRMSKTYHYSERYKNEYTTIKYAYLMMKSVSLMEFSSDIRTLVANYQKESYLIDSYYRWFYYAYDQIEDNSKFADVRQRVENIYANTYLQKITPKWNENFTNEVMNATDLPKQEDFYKHYLRGYDGKQRVIVIISDAFRYECARELLGRLELDEKCTPKMECMLSCLPSVTSVGMASLLPHKEMQVDGNLNVTVDGQACASMEQRDKILKSYNENNVALSFDEVANANQARIRELIQGKNIVYIYHNQVDARGDKPASENEVFNACAEAIEEIHKLVKKLTGYVSAPKFFITADHGFLYKRDRLQEFDNSLKSISLPVLLKTIGDAAFKGTGLRTLDIPKSVFWIGDDLLAECKSLEHIKIPDNIARITDRMFMNCSRLKKVELHEKLNSIGERAFFGCSNLEFIIIPDSVQQIGQDAFTGTDNMFIVQCSFGSFAEQYCRKNKIKYQLV